jgi:hypothetical protein
LWQEQTRIHSFSFVWVELASSIIIPFLSDKTLPLEKLELRMSIVRDDDNDDDDDNDHDENSNISPYTSLREVIRNNPHLLIKSLILDASEEGFMIALIEALVTHPNISHFVLTHEQ